MITEMFALHDRFSGETAYDIASYASSAAADDCVYEHGNNMRSMTLDDTLAIIENKLRSLTGLKDQVNELNDEFHEYLGKVKDSMSLYPDQEERFRKYMKLRTAEFAVFSSDDPEYEMYSGEKVKVVKETTDSSFVEKDGPKFVVEDILGNSFEAYYDELELVTR